MKNLKRFLALGLAATMVLSMAACGNKQKGGAVSSADAFGTGDGVIDIGSWWVQYYDSDDKMEDSVDWVNAQYADDDTEEKKAEKAINQDVAQRKWDNVKKMEEKYGVKFYWQNLTYEGVKDSINTSILAGNPDCEVYLVEASTGVPAQTNGLAVDLKTVLPEDHALLKNEDPNMGYLDLGDGKACILYRKSAQSNVEATWPLGYNKQLLDANNLEDPRALYERGEWTWDKFIEYCKVLTQDTDGDGQIDQYGYCGFSKDAFEQILMSNGANIASGQTEALSDAKTGECLQLLYDLYNTYNVAYPYDFEGEPWNSMRSQYHQGNIGFFPIACWVNNSNGDYGTSKTATFDTVYCHWPVGPSGNKDTNFGKNAVSGTDYYMIAAGCKNPGTAFNVIYDFFNWYEGDTSLRDNPATMNWWYQETANDETLQKENFNIMFECGDRTTVDFWQSLGFEYDFDSLIKGEMTPAQFQETYKQQVQDALDAYFK